MNNSVRKTIHDEAQMILPAKIKAGVWVKMYLKIGLIK